MTFYFKAPRGRIELDKIIDCLQQRLELITSIAECDKISVPKNLTYFVEGTAIDRTSHYLLRLVSSEHPSFQRHVIDGETALFRKRLEFLDSNDFLPLLKTCYRHCTELLATRHKHVSPNHFTFLESVRNLSNDILRKPNVSFRTCLGLVSRRKVRLLKGEALVSCGAWRLLLIDIFRQHLCHGYEDLTLSGCTEEALIDPRILQLTRLMRFKFKSLLFLPPCIAIMLNTLRAEHRIGHHARVTLTLILKEAGMPLKEALAFWQQELSTPTCQKHGKRHAKCTHSWQTDERKFTYSIRHLYGYEGARKNYAAPSCTTIQEKLLAPGEVGGCPFVRLPEDALVPVLSGISEGAVTDVTKLAQEGKPLQACRCLLLGRLTNYSKTQQTEKLQCKNVPTISFSKPAQFHSICRDWSNEF
ncbi:hypothetical protein B566_EDAN001669 [Ephemera danica]|nr:hypothetical protein B566_EDAN001669 [Ephemera danica]